jgi:hypothetical protein
MASYVDDNMDDDVCDDITILTHFIDSPTSKMGHF